MAMRRRDVSPIGFVGFDSTALPAAERFSIWASSLPFYRLTTPDPMRFEARIRAWNLSSVIVVDADMSAVRFVRTESQARSDQREELMFHLIVRGCLAGRTEDRAMLALPGDIAVHDRREAVEAVLARGRHIAVSLPRHQLEEALPDCDLHGAVLRGGAAHLLRGFMAALPDALASREPDPAELGRVARDVIAAAVRGSDHSVAAMRDSTLRNRVKRHVTHHLAEPLEVADLCRAFAASRSSLYRAFRREGGVMRYVQARRLERLHRLLSDPAERRPISELAVLNGFHDPSHCSRLFRLAFGYGPQALRRRVARERDERDKRAAAEDGAVEIFKTWEAARA